MTTPDVSDLEPGLEDPAEVVAQIVEDLEPTPVTTVDVQEALGLTLAADAVAISDLPRAATSAMDGFAVRSEDLRLASPGSPTSLKLVGTSYAGAGDPPTVGEGQACTIGTGGVIPSGADAIVRVEEVTRHADHIDVPIAPAPGRDVRKRGEDLSAGDVVVRAGETLSAPHVAAIAGACAPKIEVHARPAVALIVTGDEVVAAGQDPNPGQVADACGPAIASKLASLGARVIGPTHAPDDPETLRAHLLGTRADLVVTVGGASRGDRDILTEALDDAVRHQVALRPAKPLVTGRSGGTVLLGLPGNPVSALVAFEVFVRPALVALGLGFADSAARRPATLTDNLADPGGRWHWIRAVLDEERVTPLKKQGAGMLAPLGQGNSWVILPPNAGPMSAGDRVTAQPFEA